MMEKKAKPEKVADLVLRRVGRHHFAFLKGYLEGLDLRDLAWRYLETCDEEDVDLRVVFTSLAWIRHDLKLVAKRHGKASMARAIMLNPEQLVTPVSKIPSLDQFREEVDPDDMFSESELIELFQEQYSIVDSNSKAQRNVRLRQRQTDALVWLQDMVVADPTLQDNVAAWLRPNLSNKLVKGEIHTVQQLIALVNAKGYRWYSTIPALGEHSARRIVKWLTINAVVLDSPIDPKVHIKRSKLDIVAIKKDRQCEQAIVPLEYFRPGIELSGSAGENRGDRNKSGVDNDYDAIQLWLSTYQKDSHTWRSFRKEAERFLLWAILERGKPISSFNAMDCLAYRDFLWDLGRLSNESWSLVYKIPEGQWLGKRNTERWSDNWRPFEQLSRPKPPKLLPKPLRLQWVKDNTKRNGVLMPSSQRLAHTIVSSMCRWLTNRRYLDSNPWDGIKPRLVHAPEISVDHSFTADQWTYLMQFLNTLDKNSNYYRLRFILILGYVTGLRLSEMAGAIRSDLRHKAGIGWILTVIGKGQVKREVPFPTPVMDALLRYFEHRGYASFDEAPQDCPLFDFLTDAPTHLTAINNIAKKRKDQATISHSRLYRSLKKFFSQAADHYESFSPEDAKHIRLASTHWLRHTSGSHAVANGVPIEVIQTNFGHSSVDTTSIYITAEINRRIELMEKFASEAFPE